MLFRRDDVFSSQKWNEHTSSCGGFSLPILLVGVFSLLTLFIGAPLLWSSLLSPNQAQAQEISQAPTLIETATKIFTVNIPASFKELVTMAALEVEGETLFGGSVTFAGGSVFDGQITLQGDVFADGINIDLGSGEITASNVLYSLTEGDGIDISTGQTPTITNSDKGSSQNIFKKVKLGDDNIEADSNTDTLEFAAGSGISLSIDTSNDKLTISNSAVPGFVKSGTYALFADGVTRVGINTSTPSNTMEVNSGTTDTSGITFTQLTSSSAAGVGGGKVLSVDSGGKIILVTDQTGSTPTAESVLPSATNGMTLYFNGTNWVASDNLFHDGGSVGISNAAPTSRFHVNTNLASKIGVIVQGYTSQTANLQEWRNSSGSILSYIDSNGVFNGSANTSGSLNPGFTTGSVAFQGTSGLTQDNSNFFWDDTNNRLGIGTNSPDTLLTFPGSGATLSSTPNRIQLWEGLGYGFGMSTGSLDYQSAGKHSFYTSNTALKMTLDSDGNFGIGTSSTVTHKFQVSGATTGKALAMLNETGDQNILTASASGTTRMVLTSAGLMGLGTTSPGGTLHVNGSIVAGSTTPSSIASGDIFTRGGLAIGNSSVSPVTGGPSIFDIVDLRTYTSGSSGIRALVNFNTSTGGLTFTGASVTARDYVSTNANINTLQGYLSSVQIQSTNNITTTHLSNYSTAASVGTGNTVSFLYGLKVSDLAANSGTISTTYGVYVGDITLGTQTNTPFSFYASDANAYNYFAGNVGIGTTIPGYKLEVNGTSYFGAQARFNGALFMHSNTSTTFFGSGNQEALAFRNNSATDGAWTSLSFQDASANEVAAIGMKVTDQTNHYGALAFGTKGTDGKTTRMYIDPQGNVGIGTTAPTSKLHVEGLYGANALARFNQTGSGDILTASASGTTRMVLTSAGDLGIGTNIPKALIQVKRPSAGFTTTYFTVDDWVTSGGAAALVTGRYTSTGYSAGLAAQNKTEGAVTFSAGIIGEAGQFGGGITSGEGYGVFGHSAALSGTGSTLTHQAALAGMITTGNSATTVTNMYGLRIKDIVNSGNAPTVTNTYGVYIGDITVGGSVVQTNTPFSFYASDANAYNYFAGNVAVGTTTPVSKLTLFESSTPKLTFGNTNRSANAGFNFIGLTSNGQQLMYNGGFNASAGYGHVFVADTNNREIMRLEATGTVGIGTTAPSSVLHVEAPTGATLARFNQTGSGDILTASASGTTRLVVTNAGRVGIGTANPTQALTINGQVINFTSSDAQVVHSTSNDGLYLASSPDLQSGFRATGHLQFLIDSDNDQSDRYFRIAKDSDTFASATELFRVQEDGNVGIGASTFGTSAAKVLAIAGSTAPSTAITDGIQMFAVDQAGSHELRVMDEAGNTTTLSPHNFSVIGDQSEEMAWSFYSERNSLAINADMTKALRLVEKLSGEKLVYLKDLESGFLLEDDSDATHLTELADNGTIGEIAKWNYELWTYVGEVVFEKPVTFLASIRANGPVWLGGRVTFADKDMAGLAEIQAGVESISITFATPYEKAPIVTITPQNSWAQGYVTNVTTTGFTIQLSSPQTQTTTFAWQALAAENAQTTQSTATPASTPVASPAVTPTPSPSPEPSPQPSPTPQPSDEPSTPSGDLTE